MEAADEYARGLLARNKAWEAYTPEEQLILGAYCERNKLASSSSDFPSDLSMISSVPSTASDLPTDLLRKKYNETYTEYDAWRTQAVQLQQRQSAEQSLLSSQQQQRCPPQTPSPQRGSPIYGMSGALGNHVFGGSPKEPATASHHEPSRPSAGIVTATSSLPRPSNLGQLRGFPHPGLSPGGDGNKNNDSQLRRLHEIRQQHDKLVRIWRHRVDEVLDCEQHMRQLLLEADEIGATLRSSGIDSAAAGGDDALSDLVGSVRNLAQAIPALTIGSKSLSRGSGRVGDDGGSDTETPAKGKSRKKRRSKGRKASGEAAGQASHQKPDE